MENRTTKRLYQYNRHNNKLKKRKKDRKDKSRCKGCLSTNCNSKHNCGELICLFTFSYMLIYSLQLYKIETNHNINDNT